jgi:hypothetical protein
MPKSRGFCRQMQKSDRICRSEKLKKQSLFSTNTKAGIKMKRGFVRIWNGICGSRARISVVRPRTRARQRREGKGTARRAAPIVQFGRGHREQQRASLSAAAADAAVLPSGPGDFADLPPAHRRSAAVAGRCLPPVLVEGRRQARTQSSKRLSHHALSGGKRERREDRKMGARIMR